MIASQFYLLKNDRHRLIIRLMFISLAFSRRTSRRLPYESNG